MRTCSKCKTEQPDSEFRADMRDKQCKTCKREYQRELRRKGYKPSGKNKRLAEMTPEKRKLWDLMVARCTDVQARIRRYKVAGDKPKPEQLIALWHKQGGCCALTGKPMSLDTGSHWVASVDKIVPDIGYVEDNMQLAAWCANRAKGDMTLDEFESMCFDVVRKVQRLS